MNNLIILTGPTGIGKTEISLNIAEKLNCEIISCDSMQIYRDLDIGTAKVNLEDVSIIHHMIDIINPDQEFSVSEFQKLTRDLIASINNKGKLPMLVGGTGLYINSIVYNLEFANISKDDNYRKRLNQISMDKGSMYLHDKLKELDPREADKIHPNNNQRIIRALEIIHSGKVKGKNFRQENNDYNLAYIALNMDRQNLYDRINLRVIDMINEGLIEETKSAIDKYNLSRDNQSMKAIGYKEVIDYLENIYTKNSMIEEIQKNSRHYAKRQLTWFKRDNRIKWIEKQSPKLLDSILKYIGEKIERI
ncbi:tRNA dimethylallyltransferase [Peptoniphilus olsenii]|uniref:tRNA dimethylallyltransferase n=1 Tax=Peptoniphilus olsenii TaxID=411570 RepID=A0ABV2J866_9FIRM